MQLSYRGHHYQLNNNCDEPNYSEALVNYRGINYRLPRAVKTANQLASELKYRGISYRGSCSNNPEMGGYMNYQPVI